MESTPPAKAREGNGTKQRGEDRVQTGASMHVLPQPAWVGAGLRKSLRLRHGHIEFLGRDIATPLVLLALAEFLVLMGSLYIAVQLRFPGEPTAALATVQDNLLLKMLTFAMVNLIAMLSMGLYRKGACNGFVSTLLRLSGGLAFGAGVLAVLFYVLPGLTLGRGVLVLAFGLAVLGLLVTRFVGVRLLEMKAFRRRVLVLGAGRKASQLEEIRTREDQPPFELFGFVPGNTASFEVPPEHVVEPDLPLAQYAQRNHVDDVVIALDEARGAFPLDELMACKMGGIDVLEISDFLEREAGILKLDSLRPSTMIFARGFKQSLYRDVTKRVLDVTTSLVLLLVAWPFMLLTALGILIESRGRGSVLFRQVRVGQHGRHFTLLKFRSMIMEAESDGVARWAEQADPRITRFGRFIRKTRFDELPQLFNVLRGDMSFVGPRPERPVFVRHLAEHLAHYEHRHWVKPGLTGWAQIHYPYGASLKDALEKLQYDLYYVKNQSITLDLLTIVQTVEVVLWGRGSR